MNNHESRSCPQLCLKLLEETLQSFSRCLGAMGCQINIGVRTNRPQSTQRASSGSSSVQDELMRLIPQRRCANQGETQDQQLALQEQGSGPISPEAQAMMTKSYSVMSFGDTDNDCPICLEKFSDVDPATTLQCGHRFHLQCIYSWLERQCTCPVCDRKMLWNE